MPLQVCERVGSCRVDEDGNIVELEREFFSHGYIFKDWDAFYHKPDAPCYVPELDDTVYTGADFRKLCGSQEEIAEELFYEVDWQSPSTLLDEWERDGEIATCGKCGKMFMSYNVKKCPHCGAANHNGG